MGNPAELLADLLDQWEVKAHVAPETARGRSATDALTFWRTQGRAISLLLEIETMLRGMAAAGDKVDHYVETLPAWYAAVFTFTAPWNSQANGSRPVAQEVEIRLLRALGGQLDLMRAVPKADASSIERLQGALARAEQLIRESDDLPDAARRYMLGLVEQALSCAKEIETFGAASLRSLTFELGGAMHTIADQIDDEDKSRTWRQAARDIGVQVISGGVVALGMTAIQAITG